MQTRTLSEVLADAAAQFSNDETRVSVGEITQIFHERGIGFMLLIFAVPMALPLPVPPGINILLALPLVFLTSQLALGRHTPWMPGFVSKKTFKSSLLRMIFEKTIPWARRLECIIKPRLELLTGPTSGKVVGGLGLIMALAVCIPIPLSNTVPSFGIAVMAVGLIMRDGLAVIAGALIGTLWVCALGFLGQKGIELVVDMVKGFIG